MDHHLAPDQLLKYMLTQFRQWAEHGGLEIPVLPREIVRVMSYNEWTGDVKCWAVHPTGEIRTLTFFPEQQVSGGGYLDPPEWNEPSVVWGATTCKVAPLKVHAYPGPVLGYYAQAPVLP